MSKIVLKLEHVTDFLAQQWKYYIYPRYMHSDNKKLCNNNTLEYLLAGDYIKKLIHLTLASQK